MAETRFMTINMGPQHPATHGVLRLVLELDGEVIVKVTPHIGHLHRGLKNLAKAKPIISSFPSPTVWTIPTPWETTWPMS